MDLQDADIKKLAELSRLQLPEHQIHAYREQLTDILRYVDQIQKVAGEDISTESADSRLREDEPAKSLGEPSELLKAAPHVEEDHITVLKVH